MGRGRQKAKQTKVARKLKYYSPETDYEALQRELQAERRRKGQFDDDSDDVYYSEDDESWRYGDVPPATD
ncbi:MAG: DUF3073 domain-containing protein [Actinomycetaceae bacterium]|nr:DUF3073 domain-containing protein [Actinomycetaceae bacterium]